MTVNQLFINGKKALAEAQTDNYENEALFLLEKVTGLNRTQIYFNGDKDISSDKEREYFELIEKRKRFVPIQYLIGEWDFYGESFSVGEGVLIPRPETEILVETAVKAVSDIEKPIIYDLCSGSGCIGITLARLLPKAEVILAEKYDEAFYFLQKNVNAFALNNVTAVKADICDKNFANSIDKCDLIVSNPPYIKSAEIPTLQKEVLCEPHTALDGGDDGLDFYRIIKALYSEKCYRFTFECGEEQSNDILNIFSEYKCKIIKDFEGHDRVIEVKR